MPLQIYWKILENCSVGGTISYTKDKDFFLETWQKKLDLPPGGAQVSFGGRKLQKICSQGMFIEYSALEGGLFFSLKIKIC